MSDAAQPMTREELNDLRGLLDGTRVFRPPRKLDFDHEALFGALGRVELSVSPIQLKEGLFLQKTFAHVFSAPMAAFSPPPLNRGPHPAPWAVVHGRGEAEDFVAEIVLEAGAKPLPYERLETVRMVAALIRLLAAQPVFVASIAPVSMGGGEAHKAHNPIYGFERTPHWHFGGVTIDEKYAELLRTFLDPTSLILKDDSAYRAFVMLDGIWWLPTTTAMMVAIWTSVETMLRPGRRDVTKRLADGVRRYVGQSKSDGDRLYNETVRLYESRGQSAHAGRSPAIEDVHASFVIAHDVMLRAMHEGQLPDLDNLTPVWAT
ncbi:hypothetical protein [Methylopila sp. Yamaguchi]|uniref:hypothetical protein n=1 Tax=Methylopila sp. Yamaguchi TaxID=1437817 RepID=UPI000CB96B16|nr:hypothetical protein [Methylopila sp. Yamaguchi]GBD48543.1 hypothetical protein METY_1756 [Methylopila sp. Yamaguchi]